jgi:hypothetical protein
VVRAALGCMTGLPGRPLLRLPIVEDRDVRGPIGVWSERDDERRAVSEVDLEAIAGSDVGPVDNAPNQTAQPISVPGRPEFMADIAIDHSRPRDER